MAFSSLVFLFFFLPVSLLLSWSVGQRLKNSVLLLASLLFYAWGGARHLPLLLGVVAGNYLFGLFLGRARPGWQRQAILSLGIAANLAPLLLYKYSAFFLNLRHVLPVPLSSPIPPDQPIPLGISFITFHALSYLMDIGAGKAHEQRNPLELGLYLTMFPKVISGPILRYADAAAQLNGRSCTLADLGIGVERFIVGLAKKLLLANPLADMADHVFSAPADSLSVGIAWLGIFCYSLQIFFDFAGYTDMAVGLGRMFGFHFPENFNYPYAARSVREFWQRWHITLSRWFRDYLYLPLGGNRHGAATTYRNLAIVFLLCGLWHGASWNFIIWGLLHGGFLVLERWRLAKLLDRVPRLVQHLYLLLFLQVSWVFFRAPTLTAAVRYLGAMLGLGTTPKANPWILLKMDGQTVFVLVLACLLALPVLPRLADILRRGAPAGPVAGQRRLPLYDSARMLLLLLLLLLAVMELAAGTYNPFIYCRF